MFTLSTSEFTFKLDTIPIQLQLNTDTVLQFNSQERPFLGRGDSSFHSRTLVRKLNIHSSSLPGFKIVRGDNQL